MNEAVLQVRNLESNYGPIRALRGISVDVAEGRIIAILGANGAGKTTLLKTISGIIEPEKGTVKLAGEEIAHMEPDEIVSRGIAHVPEGREIFPLLTVAENLAMGGWTRRDNAINHDMETMFRYFPVLEQRRNQAGQVLSGGQQQMLAIARGLMAKPRLLLLDEPSLGLAPIMVREIFSIIDRLNKEQGITMLLVEQNARAALEIADFVYVMETGRIVMEGPSARLKQSPDIQDFYLGTEPVGIRGERRWKRRKTWR